MLAWTDAAKDTPPTPAPPDREADDSAQRDYDLPIPSTKALPKYCEHNENDNKTKEKVAPRTLHQCPLIPTTRKMIVPR